MARFSHDEWAALSPMLDEVLELSPDARELWLAQRRLDRPEIAARVEELLQLESELDDRDFLSDRRAPELPKMFSLAGQSLGAYVLERPLGEGGMGSVWLARRSDGRFEGVAAIKFLSLAVATPAGEARFRREGSLLSRLTHPNIARLLDAGVSPSGLPYLVLEYIDGQQIDQWCDARTLSIDARLRLFRQVLSAVAHAHANFIVHRDLKPANILVTGDGTVKLLDFGIAKLLEQGGSAASALTGANDTLYTYRYAAPEQIQAAPITTATDVYSLGVILYELLAGRHPTSNESRTPAQHVVAILDTDAASLARAVTPSGALPREEAVRLAAARSVAPEKLRRLFAGDLENIVAKALKKDPLKRYATVASLDEDVRRHLEHQPVGARADSLRYRAGKFVRRNRLSVSVAALVAAGLIAAAARERQLRARAESEAKKAVAVEEYLVGIFGAADPFAPTMHGAENITARALLDRGAERIDTALSTLPEVRAELRGALGGVYANLGVYDKAASELRRSLAERRAIYGNNNGSVAEAMDQLGEVLSHQDHLDEADSLLRGALTTRRALYGDRSEPTAQSLDHLADLLFSRDDFEHSEPLFREALATRRALYGDSSLAVATSRHFLGQLLMTKGANADAAAEFRQVLAIRHKGLGDEHPATAEAIHDLANVEEHMGNFVDAERHYRQALAIQRKTLGTDHRSVTLGINDLGQLLFKVGRLAEADSMLREALAINRRMFGERHESVTANLANLALVVRERGDFPEAARLFREALSTDRELFGAEHVNVGFDLNELAVVMRLEKRPDSAVALLRHALAISERVSGDKDRGTIMINVNLARALVESGQRVEPEKMLRKALGMLGSTNANDRLGIIPANVGLGRILIRTRRAREALPLLERTVAMSDTQLGAAHWRTGEAKLVMGECLLALGEATRAQNPLRVAREVLVKQRVSHPALAAEASDAISRLERAQRDGGVSRKTGR